MRIVHSAKTACMPWRLRCEWAIKSVSCSACGIDVEYTQEQEGYTPLCIYCAMDQGVIPEDEWEPGDNRTLHQIAMGEPKRLDYDEWEP